MSDSEDGARNEASELKGLPKGTFALMVRLGVARAELAACTSTLRRRPVMARPWRWWLACCKVMVAVRGVLRRVRLG